MDTARKVRNRKEISSHLHARSHCLRWELPEASPLGDLSPAFLEDLKAHDRQLDLIWHPVRRLWEMYRIRRRGVTPGMDELLHEFTVCGPQGEYREPGTWLLAWMRRVDSNRGGLLTREENKKRFVNRVDRDQETIDIKFENDLSDRSQDLVDDVVALDKEKMFSYKGQKHFGNKD